MLIGVELVAKYWIVFLDNAWKFPSQCLISSLSGQSNPAIGSWNFTNIELNYYKHRICLFANPNLRLKNGNLKYIGIRSNLIFSNQRTQANSTLKRKKRRKR